MLDGDDLRRGEAAEWGRNQPPPATPGAGDPEQLAEHPDPDRADSHYSSPQVVGWCRANDVDFIFGVRRPKYVAEFLDGAQLEPRRAHHRVEVGASRCRPHILRKSDR
ncbi:hypothetical protein MPLDJ20_130065 [Mesorhizobium plurifarium]|uniref:Transposase n=1 Tax=Mesorhizobium plurifarium TaxID=69974 RepID=A0A090EP40_MESPL|nr:hypothetical protein MPLDJ20_130065 [Mesorhizobium plurifarium]